MTAIGAGTTSQRLRSTVAMTLLGPDGHRTPLVARLCWCSTDPWALQVTFGSGPGAKCWLMALDLLVAGCSGPAGLGDVSVLPAHSSTAGAAGAVGPGEGPRVVELIVSSPSGQACFEVRVEDLITVLARFLDARDLHAEHDRASRDGGAERIGQDRVDVELARLISEYRAESAGGEDW